MGTRVIQLTGSVLALSTIVITDCAASPWCATTMSYPQITSMLDHPWESNLVIRISTISVRRCGSLDFGDHNFVDFYIYFVEWDDLFGGSGKARK